MSDCIKNLSLRLLNAENMIGKHIKIYSHIWTFRKCCFNITGKNPRELTDEIICHESATSHLWKDSLQHKRKSIPGLFHTEANSNNVYRIAIVKHQEKENSQ